MSGVLRSIQIHYHVMTWQTFPLRGNLYSWRLRIFPPRVLRLLLLVTQNPPRVNIFLSPLYSIPRHAQNCSLLKLQLLLRANNLHLQGNRFLPHGLPLRLPLFGELFRLQFSIRLRHVTQFQMLWNLIPPHENNPELNLFDIPPRGSKIQMLLLIFLLNENRIQLLMFGFLLHGQSWLRPWFQKYNLTPSQQLFYFLPHATHKTMLLLCHLLSVKNNQTHWFHILLYVNYPRLLRFYFLLHEHSFQKQPNCILRHETPFQQP